MIDQKEIKTFIHAARVDNEASIDNIEKHVFTSFVAGMHAKLIEKLLKNDSEETRKQIAALERMESFLERLSFKNCVFYFQAKTILAQDRRLAILEQDKRDLIIRAKKRIEELEKEVEILKRNIK